MNRGPAAALALCALLVAVPAAGQEAGAASTPAPARYLLTAAAAGGRALWVNPAGLARQVEASIGADVTFQRGVASGAGLRQWGATVASRGLAGGWEHTRMPSGSALNAYSVGLALGDPSFSAGMVRRWYRGALAGSAWDAGVDVTARGGAELAIVARNLGAPRLGDSTYWPTVVPAALVTLLGGRLQLGGEWAFSPHGWRSLEYRAGATVALGSGLALLIRADLDRDFRRHALIVALDLEAPKARVAAFGVLPGSANQFDAVGAAGALVTRAPAMQR